MSDDELKEPSKTKYIPEFEEGLAQIVAIEPILAETIAAHEFPAFYVPDQPKPKKTSFEHLIRSVISQQISGTAAASILSRFFTLAPTENTFPTPEQISVLDIEQLRGIGFSQRKAEYTIGIAKLYAEGDLSDELFSNLSNEEVYKTITAVRGLGPWTAEMFLIFYLNRMDVFSPSDLGVQRGMRRYAEMLGLKVEINAKKPKQCSEKMTELASRFQPHRTAFQMVLWKLSDIQMQTVEARINEQVGKRKLEETKPAKNAKSRRKK